MGKPDHPTPLEILTAHVGAEMAGTVFSELKAYGFDIFSTAPGLFIKGAISDAYESGWRPDGFGGAPLKP